jgi:protein CpxP
VKPLLVLLILLGGAAAMSAHAQSPSQTQAPGAAPAAPQHSPTEVVEMLGKRLSLSDQQKSQILPIITERQQKIQALRNDASLPPQQRMSQVQVIMKDSDARRMRPYHQQGSAAQ